jgi:hypothetical protein
MDAIQAAVLRVKLPYIAEWNRSRQQHAATYDQLFAESGLTSKQVRQTNGSAPVRLLARSPQATHVFHQYVIRAQRRDELRKFLADRKIGSEVYYPLPLHLQPVFSYLGLKAGDLPVAEQAAQEVLALPMFPELTEAEIRLGGREHRRVLLVIQKRGAEILSEAKDLLFLRSQRLCGSRFFFRRRFAFLLSAFRATVRTGCSPGASTRRTIGVLSLYLRSPTLPLSSCTRMVNTGSVPSLSKFSCETVTGRTPSMRSR